jgi:hypothetical protein
MSRVGRAALLVATILSNASCGAIIAVAGGPPADHRSRTDFRCVQSNALPMLDLFPMGLFIMAQLIFADKPTWIPSALLAGSVVVGRQTTQRCRDAKIELAKRNAIASAVASGVSLSAARPIPVVIDIVPETATVVLGATVRLNAEVRASSGALVEGLKITWHSRRNLTARVTNTGVVTGRSLGAVLIDARTSGVIGTAIVTVVPP